MFHETSVIRFKLRLEIVARTVFTIMTIAAIIPLIAIVTYLVAKAAPVLSWEFVSEFPRKGMTEGGIFPALLGTLYMVGLSLLIATPIGVLAAVYLNEYAGDNWFTRIVNLAVVNLAGVTSIVHALLSGPAIAVGARVSVTVVHREVGQHRIQHARIGARSGVVVHVDEAVRLAGFT